MEVEWKLVVEMLVASAMGAMHRGWAQQMDVPAAVIVGAVAEPGLRRKGKVAARMLSWPAAGRGRPPSRAGRQSRQRRLAGRCTVESKVLFDITFCILNRY